MNKKEMENQIIRQYQADEKMMVLVFAQWCINNGLDPEELYQRAYPGQPKSHTLTEALELTVPREEAGDIADDTLLGVLSLFGNEDLAYIATLEIAKRDEQQNKCT